MLNHPLTKQFLPLLSVIIAVTALLYSTWRSETTEAQRSLRQAGFAVMERMTTFEGHVFVMAYTPAEQRVGNEPFMAWAAVREIKDLASALPQPIPARANAVFERWSSQFNALSNWSHEHPESVRHARSAADQISDDVQALREQIISTVTAFE